MATLIATLNAKFNYNHIKMFQKAYKMVSTKSRAILNLIKDDKSNKNMNAWVIRKKTVTY